MAVTAQKSDQIDRETARPVTIANPADDHAKLRTAYFNFAQSGAGDADSTIDLARLPSGRVRVYAGLSRVSHSAFGASRTLDIGHAGYKQPDDTDIAADEDALHADANVATASGFTPSGATGDGEMFAYDAAAPVLFKAKVEGGTIPDGATLEGFIVYAVD